MGPENLGGGSGPKKHKKGKEKKKPSGKKLKGGSALLVNSYRC